MKQFLWNKWIKRGLVFGLVIAVVSFIGIQWIAPVSILKPFRSYSPKTPADNNLLFEPVSIKTFDDVNLSAYWIPFQGDSVRGTIIFLHGIGGCKEHFIDLATKASAKGYHTLVYDARAHGKSGGKYCTYGIREKKDVSAIVDFILSKAPDLPIGVWGNSLGGAVAIQALESEERLSFGIIESTFINLRQIVFDYKKRITGIGLRGLSDYTLSRSGVIAGFNPDDVSPENLVKNISQPVLIVHGNADRNISVDYGRTLFENLASDQKELVIIEGGNHYNTRMKGGEDYLQKAFGFIENALK